MQLVFPVLTGTCWVQITITTSNRRIRNNPTTAHKFSLWHFKVLNFTPIRGAILCDKITHSRHNCLYMCFHHSKWEQCTLFTQCSNVSYESRHKQRLLSRTAVTDIFLSVNCAFILIFLVRNKIDVMNSFPYVHIHHSTHTHTNAGTHTYTERFLKPFSREFIIWRSFPNLLHEQ